MGLSSNDACSGTHAQLVQSRMVYLVNSILDLHKKLFTIKTDHEKTIIMREIEAADTQIDSLVYELYGLTEEEIKIVEGKE